MWFSTIKFNHNYSSSHTHTLTHTLSHFSLPFLHTHTTQEAQIEELEAQLQNVRADLKNAQKRIDTLHGALKGHETYSDEDPQEEDVTGDYEDDDLSSNASSYKVGEIDDMSMNIDDMSDTEGSGLDQSPIVRSRRLNRDLTPKIEEEDEDLTYSRKGRKISADSGDVKLTKYDRKDSDDEFSRRRSRDYLKDSDDEITPKRKISSSKLKESPRKSRSPDRLSESKSKSKTLSLRRDKTHLYDTDDDDDDDDDLEEFLLKQRERTRRLQDEGDSFEPISIVSRHSKSPSHEEDRKPNGRDKSLSTSRDDSGASIGEGKVSESARALRRKKQRRRTIEQLTSPEHLAAKASGGAS